MFFLMLYKMTFSVTDDLHPFVYNFLIGLQLHDLARTYLSSLSDENKRMIEKNWKIAEFHRVICHEKIKKIIQSRGKPKKKTFLDSSTVIVDNEIKLLRYDMLNCNAAPWRHT